MKLHSLLLLGLLLSPAAEAQTPIEARLEVTVTDDASGEALGYAVCALRPKEGNGKERAAAADAQGVCLLEGLKPGRFELHILYMGHVFRQGDLQLPSGLTRRSVRLDIDPVAIGEVLVTAAESKGPASSSKIGRDAIAHIQPSSIADLLELIPGGRASDPVFGAPQEIRLREASPSSNDNYATSALGTQIQVDGIPISNDANLQYSTSLGSIREYTNVDRGVDTRAISTDDIESVEIVRGIPSVEYGDLTSGLVKVKRREGGRDLTARFKADMSSKLFSVGKGFERGRAGTDRTTLNINADYLTAAADPRNPRQNYQRLTGSVRLGRSWQGSAYRYSAGGTLDYTGSFDNKKSDQDLDNGLGGPVERYKSSYNRTQIAASLSMEARQRQFFHSLDFTASFSAQFDRIDRWKFVETGGDFAKGWGTESGEYDALIVPASYDATLLVDGKPFYGYAKAVATFNADTERSRNTLLLGADWAMDKNYGRGLVFDVARPFSPKMSSRPRAYDVIPALHKLSFFIEDATTVTLGDLRVEATGGVRATSMLNLGSRYAIQGKFYFDPRANVTVALPRFEAAGRDLALRLSGGVGWHTKLPTMNQLYPEMCYFDVTQLNYWPSNHPENRRINLRLHTDDPTNYELRAARNFKWEVRLDADWNGNQLSVTYFREDMKSGFRSTSAYQRYISKKYDAEAIDEDRLDGPPALDDLPYVMDTTLTSYGMTTNGSRTKKEGVEFTFSTQRIRAIATRITVTGAYFRTNYSNMHPEYRVPVSAPDGKPYPYVGYYFSTDGYLNEMCNTNFLLDTQIPRLKLIFSTSFQCLWFVGKRNSPGSAEPISYIDKELVSHPFTAESAADGVLSAMVRDINPTLFRYETTPFSMNVNLKITKKLYQDKMAVSLFVNKLLDYTPSYDLFDRHVRREVTPYFGMELNLKL